MVSLINHNFFLIFSLLLFLYQQSFLYLFIFFEFHRLKMDFQIEIFTKLSLTVSALEFLYPSVSFDVLLEIAHLAKGWTTVFICTFVWFFSCVDPEMSKELTHALNNLVTAYSILFVMTFEKPILFFKIVLLFDEIENIVGRIRYVVRVTKHSWIELLALNDSNLIIWENLVLFHESLCQYFLP